MSPENCCIGCSDTFRKRIRLLFGHSIPSKDANIEIIYKTLFGVKKNLSTTFPHENVDNTVRTDFPAQIFDTRYGKIKFFQPKYCALKVIHISTI